MFFGDNWEFFKNKLFSDLTLIGSHNSASCYISSDNHIATDNVHLKKISNLSTFIKNEVIDLDAFCDVFAKCQTVSLTEQFTKYNVRSFDIRVCKNPNDENDTTLYTHHTFIGNSFIVVLKELADCIQKNPKELIEIKIKWTDSGHKDLSANVLEELLKSDLSKYIIHKASEKNLSEISKGSTTSENTIENYVNSDKRVFIYVDGNELEQSEFFGSIYKFKGDYIDTNDPYVKIQELIEQLKSCSEPFYELSYSLTPQISDYISFVKKRFSMISKFCTCLVLNKKDSQSLMQLDSKFPELKIELFGIENLKKVHVISLDFVDTKKNIYQLCLDVNKEKL